jgi:eukaryotic-like serine/threonine-protein kinase
VKQPTDRHESITQPTQPGEHSQGKKIEMSADMPVDESGEYQDFEPLGQGGMGRVYRAHEPALERDVAIKFLLEPDNADRQRRFILEARAAARLGHPNIASIYRFGTWRSGTWQGQPFLVEEYVHGHSLAQTRMGWPDVLELGVTLAHALAAAHRRGVLHRDIKPGNVIISNDGVPKLIDFGLAKLSSCAAEPARHGTPVLRYDTQGHDAASTNSTLMGTPRYLAPEIWRGQGSSPGSDVYSLGVLLYQLCAGRTPFHDVPEADLDRVTNERAAPTLSTTAPDVDARLAAIINQCLARDPGARFASADELHDALHELAWTRTGHKPLPGEPYRGLRHFESTHQAFFFGREREARELADRLRKQPLLLVAGGSGVGKSSLVRAGLMPLLARTELDGRRWRGHTMVPGRHPLTRLAAELARILDTPESTIATEMTGDMAALARRARIQGSAQGILLFVDQLEELVTLSEAGEAARVSQVLACLAERVPTMRVIATVRDDKIADVARLPELGAHIERGGLYFLQPMDAASIREAVVGPARAKGVRFASSTVVDTLVAATENAPGGLPLLQFALASIWQQRDVDRGCIPENALDAIGGVDGALARHADSVLRNMPQTAQDAARRILLRLVTVHRTRGRYAMEELVDDGAHERALQGLVEGRLVVISKIDDQAVCELAHEALITGWPTLHDWLDRQGELRAVKQRLAHAAAEWKRQGRSRDALWRGQPLDEAARISIDDVPALEQQFLRASRGAVRRARWLRRGAMAALALLGLGVYAAVEYREKQRIARDVTEAEKQALPHLWRARAAHVAFGGGRSLMATLYNRGYTGAAERTWAWTLDWIPHAEDEYDAASRSFEHAWRRDPGNPRIQAHLATVLDARSHLAHAIGRLADRDRLLDRLEDLDGPDGRVARWRAPVAVDLRTSPARLAVRACRYRESDGGDLYLDPDCVELRTPDRLTLAPGSYLFIITATDATIEVRYPVLIEPVAVTGIASTRFHIVAPPHTDIPKQFAFIPAGAFLFGYGSEGTVEPVRIWYKTSPLYQRHTGAYAIALHETTFSEYMEFLRALSPPERARRLPRSTDPYSAVSLALEERAGGFALRLEVDKERKIEATEGQAFIYPNRREHGEQRWQRFPVLGVSAEDARAYTEWLARTGRVPGARLCREDEWERAARGADGRMFPHGRALDPGDANFDRTHGWDDGDYGPDEVGSHPASESPFGLHDTAGNAWEMVESTLEPGKLMVRSGPFFFDRSTNALVNRDPLKADQRFPYLGFRVCADVPAHAGKLLLSDGLFRWPAD